MTPEPEPKGKKQERTEQGSAGQEGAPEEPGREGIHEDRQPHPQDQPGGEARAGAGEEEDVEQEMVAPTPGGGRGGERGPGGQPTEERPAGQGERTIREAERKRKQA